MIQETIDRFVEELKAAFADAKVAREASQTLIRLPYIAFPAGCQPEGTEALVVLRPGGAPEMYVKVIPKRPDGGVPRSTGTTMVAGESWCTFSFNLSWNENHHSAEQFVFGRLNRFVRNE